MKILKEEGTVGVICDVGRLVIKDLYPGNTISYSTI